MPEVAYVLKGFPRLSELFIASEIQRLEQVGLDLRLHVIKAPDEDVQHPLVDRIRAPRTYLPQTTSLSQTTLRRWLRENLPSFLPSLRRVARRRPVGLARACGFTLAQSMRARKTFWSLPRKLYVKELLQASRSPTSCSTSRRCATCTRTSRTARRRSRGSRR